MTHYTALEWVDFVRSTGEPGVDSAMRAHLGGCPRCRRMVEVLRAVADLAQREIGYEPPERALRCAQAIYSLYQPEKSGLAQLIAQLMHDTASAPLPAGIRAE